MDRSTEQHEAISKSVGKERRDRAPRENYGLVAPTQTLGGMRPNNWPISQGPSMIGSRRNFFKFYWMDLCPFIA